MVTMKLGKNLPVKVKNEKIDEFLSKGYKFCPKSEWKKLVRDAEKPEKSEKN